jgi:hypothetical protein
VGVEEISRKIAGKLATRIVPVQTKSRSIQRFFLNLKLCQLEFHFLSKINLAKQLEHQKLHQLGKGQHLPSAEHGG